MSFNLSCTINVSVEDISVNSLDSFRPRHGIQVRGKKFLLPERRIWLRYAAPKRVGG